MTIQAVNTTDPAGRPYGGSVSGIGLQINWQEGPLRDGDHEFTRNGAFVEEVLEAVEQRIAYYQDSQFGCEENATALEYIGLALEALRERTARRVLAGVEGTWEVHEDAERGPLPAVLDDAVLDEVVDAEIVDDEPAVPVEEIPSDEDALTEGELEGQQSIDDTEEK